MTLDEAITHAREVAKDKRREATYNYTSLGEYYNEYYNECKKCAREHEQLAVWLEDLKRRIEYDDELMGSGALNNAYKSGYNKAIDDCKSIINNAYIEEYIDGFTYAIITEKHEQLKVGCVNNDR